MIKSTESGDTQYSVLGLVNSQAGGLGLTSAVSRFWGWLLATIIPPLRVLPCSFSVDAWYPPFGERPTDQLTQSSSQFSF